MLQGYLAVDENAKINASKASHRFPCLLWLTENTKPLFSVIHSEKSHNSHVAAREIPSGHMENKVFHHEGQAPGLYQRGQGICVPTYTHNSVGQDPKRSGLTLC